MQGQSASRQAFGGAEAKVWSSCLEEIQLVTQEGARF